MLRENLRCRHIGHPGWNKPVVLEREKGAYFLDQGCVLSPAQALQTGGLHSVYGEAHTLHMGLKVGGTAVLSGRKGAVCLERLTHPAQILTVFFQCCCQEHSSHILIMSYTNTTNSHTHSSHRDLWSECICTSLMVRYLPVAVLALLYCSQISHDSSQAMVTNAMPNTISH